MPVGKKVRDVVLRPGIKIVGAKDLVTLAKKPFTQMRAEKSGAAGHQNFFSLHIPSQSWR